VARDIFGKYVPSNVPGADLEKTDMARVTEDDFAEIRKLARGYCRTVDATRSRKRMDGSATVARGGFAPYGYSVHLHHSGHQPGAGASP
jgi:hypothetical protein